MIREAAVLALMAAGPAAAAGMSDDLTRCAAFWYGAADFRARFPKVSEPPDTVLRMAREFRDRAIALSDATTVDTAIARDRRDMARMNEAYVFAADPETIALWERTAQRCDALASTQSD